MYDERFWNPKDQGCDADARRAALTTRVIRQLDYAYQSSAFYREQLRKAGYRPGSVTTFDEFRDLPVLFNKADERESLSQSVEQCGHPYGLHLCADPRAVTIRHATSGTSGYPTWYLFTDSDYEMFVEAGARYWYWCGIRPGDTVLFAMGSGMWVSALFVSALRSMGACPIPVGMESGPEEILRYARLCRPTALLATPSLCKLLIEQDGDVSSLGLRSLILGGEPGAGTPAVKRQLEASYGATVYDIIGPFWGNAYASCTADEYQGLHCLTDDLAVWHQDLRDPITGDPVPVYDGAVGEAVTTAGAHEAAPMVKFGSGDVLRVSLGRCTCGFEGDRVRILGRSDDMLSVSGQAVFPTEIAGAVADAGAEVTGELRIRLLAPPASVTPPVPLRVEHRGTLSDTALRQLRAKVEASVRAVTGIEAAVELVPEGTLPRSAGKTELVVHEYAG